MRTVIRKLLFTGSNQARTRDYPMKQTENFKLQKKGSFHLILFKLVLVAKGCSEVQKIGAL